MDRGIPFSDRPVELRGDFVELPKIRVRPGVGDCRSSGKTGVSLKFKVYATHFVMFLEAAEF